MSAGTTQSMRKGFGHPTWIPALLSFLHSLFLFTAKAGSSNAKKAQVCASVISSLACKTHRHKWNTGTGTRQSALHTPQFKLLHVLPITFTTSSLLPHLFFSSHSHSHSRSHHAQHIGSIANQFHHHQSASTCLPSIPSPRQCSSSMTSPNPARTFS